MKYFGTDGIRGDSDYVKSLAYSLGAVLGGGDYVLVGRDTRTSSFDIERELVKGLLSNGARVGVVGIVPTPALHYLAKRRGAKIAVMITASHNPPSHNGLKVMMTEGKLSEEDEEALDGRLDRELNNPSPQRGGGTVEVLGGVREYKRHVINLFKHLDLSALDKRIYLDTAHGCFSYIAKDVLETLGADATAYNNDYDGAKVNVECGALYVDDFARMIPHDAVGFAFDGDGDRVMSVVDHRVFDGDQMLYNVARLYKKKNKAVDAVVGTVMTGGGIERVLSKEGVALVRTDVGDKHVLKAMKERNLLLGGEKSGHLIIGDKGETGDGLVTALTFLECIMGGNVKKVREYKIENYRLEAEKPRECYESAEFQNRINKTKAEIGKKGRLIIRPSGTESCVRITIEIYDSKLEYEKIIKNNLLSKTYKN